MSKLKKIWAGVTGAAIGSGILLGVLLFLVMRPESSTTSQQTGTGTSTDGVQTASVAGTQVAEENAAEASSKESTDTGYGGNSTLTAQTSETTAQTPSVTPQTEALPQTVQQTQTETAAITVSPQVETQRQAQTGDSTFYKDGTIVPTGSYIMREASERYLTDADLSRLTLKGLCYLKNELYAKHGRKFTTRALQEYFNAQSWYSGIYEPVTDDQKVVNLMNAWERANIETLDAAEAKQGYYQFP